MKKIKIYLLMALIAVVIINCTPSQKQVDNELKKIETQVANDAIKQYDIAKKSGNATDAYVQAGIVAAAFLQAKDEVNYKKWKEIEKQEGKIVGIN